MHYHKVDVFKIQSKIKDRSQANIADILTIPLADRPNWSKDDINKELKTMHKEFWVT